MFPELLTSALEVLKCQQQANLAPSGESGNACWKHRLSSAYMNNKILDILRKVFLFSIIENIGSQ